MRKLVVSEFLTLDGVMQAPGDPNEDRSGGFEHGGWQLQFFDEAFGAFVLEAMTGSGAYLFGRRTYETFAAFWPNQPADDPVAGPMNATPKYVVSTSLTEPLPWQPSTLVRDTDGIRRLRAEDGGDILLFGSGDLVQTLIRESLVDEYSLMVHPIVLGTGKRLFRDDAPLSRFELVESNASSKGVLLLRYRPTDG
jgi:dihydrofolate reductase